MKLKTCVKALVIVCITVIVLHLPATTLKIHHVEGFGLKVDQIELVIGGVKKPEQRNPTSAAGKEMPHQTRTASDAASKPTHPADM